MPNLVVPGFSGVVRILAPQRLEDHQATVAMNCDFRTQDLLPLKGLGATLSVGGTPQVFSVGTASTINSIYQYSSSKWLHYGQDIDFARTPYEDKLYGRLYMTGFDIPIVTDNTIVNNAWPSNYRYIGLPTPWNGENPPTPEITQEGEGPVASVSFTSGTTSTNPPPATVTCGEAHGLKEGSYVTLDFPGIPARSYQITLSGVDNKSTQFKLKTLGIPGTKTASAKRQGTANQPIIITWPSHGLENGDIVRVGRNVNFGSGNLIFTGTDYSVELLDAGRFTLRNGDTAVTASGTGGSAEKNIPMARINSSAYPGVLASTPTYNGTTKTFTVVYGPDTNNSTNTWTRTDVLETQVDRSYVFTLVNGYGEEGPPSKPTEPVSVTPDTAVPLDLTWIKNNVAALTKATDGPNITHLRIYRTDATGTFRLLWANQWEPEAAKLYQLGVYAEMTDTLSDNATDAQLGEPLSTQGYYPPPNDLKGITALPNGVMVGFRKSDSTGKTVCASVPFHPYAWPIEYRINTESFIVGLAPTATGLVVLTDAMPYVITGTDPASWSAVKLEAQEPCLSKRSIVDMGDYAMYASPNGLIAINGAEVKNALANIMTREQWQEYNPSSMTGSFYNGRYVGSYLSGSVRKTFVYEPATGNFIDTELDLRALWNDQKTGKLWALDSSGNLREWSAGSDLPYTWKSKLFLMPKPLNFASMQVLLEDYSQATTVQVYASDAKIPLFQGAGGVSAPKTVTDNAPFRLPSGYMTQAYQIELKGSGRVRAVGIATSTDELKEQP